MSAGGGEGAPGPVIAVAQKWVDRRPEVDPLTGAVRMDARTSGASQADEAALEWALRAAEAWAGQVVAVTAGPVGAEVVLRSALAAGAVRGVRVDLPHDAPSEDVASGLAPVVAGAALVLCGDGSLDRGSGSVPAFLAAGVGGGQALGCTDVVIDPAGPGSVRAVRRLDGGRRERLVVRAPGVLSVEPGSARLRRASLGGVLRARQAMIEVVAPPRPPRQPMAAPARQGPYRPRARVLPAPPASLDARQRIAALTGAGAPPTPPQLLVLEPAAAADRILAQLREWGYLG